MSEKSRAAATPEVSSHRSQAQKAHGVRSSQFVSDNPFFGLQQTLGNQAMLQLLESGVIQAKMRLSQPGDADEQEADRAAEKVVSVAHAPRIQRKCACAGGSPCAKCAGEDDETIHRSVAAPLLRASKPSIQRAPAEKSATPEEAPAKTARHHHAGQPLVVEDDAEKVEPHQMRKSQFLALLRTDACATADAVLMSVGKSTKGCPYIEKWLGHYEKQSSSHIEAAMRKYAPETARARGAHEAIRLLLVRIQKAALSWAKTGKVEGLPPEMASEITGQKSFLEKAHEFATTGLTGAILGFIGGKGKKEEGASTSGVMRKARTGEAPPAHDAASVRSQLGTGHSLDSRVQGQMSSAFGYDFSGVRVHTNANAGKLSSDLQARAFTIGNDVAFGSGEYRPGTLIGDALIAHELAHVVQQSSASHSSALMYKGVDSSPGQTEEHGLRLEHDADLSAVAALTDTWANAEPSLTGLRRRAIPHLRSGLQLQRCGAAASQIKRPEQTAATADAIISAANDQSKKVEDRAKEVVESIIHTYYPNEAEKVDSVEYNDAQAADGLQTHEVFFGRDRSKIKGKIYVGRVFLEGKGGLGGVNKRDFAHRVLQVGHELEHISQFRDPNLTPVRNKEERRQRKDEREFLAFYNEAVGIEKPGTGSIQHGSRVLLIDAALGYYNCFTDEKKSAYRAQFNELTNRRGEEIEQSKRGADHFGPAPTECKRASG